MPKPAMAAMPTLTMNSAAIRPSRWSGPSGELGDLSGSCLPAWRGRLPAAAAPTPAVPGQSLVR